MAALDRTMILTGVGPWEVVAAEVREALSTPTVAWVRLRLQPDDQEPDASLLGEPCVLELREFDETVRAWHLVVRAVTDGGFREGWRTFELELEDRFGLLELRTDVRIFQELDAKAIASQVFDQAGIDGKTIEWKLQRTLPTRTYCVQYRESDRAFVERILRDEGIFRIPADSPDGALAIFADSTSIFDAIEDEPSQPLLDGRAGKGVVELEVEHSIVPDRIVLRDWNYETPGVDLTVTADLASDVRSSLYEFPGGFQTQNDGNALVRIRAEELAAGQVVARGRAHVTAFRPGRWFELTEVTREPLAIKWVIREVVHHFTRLQTATYDNDFVAAPLEQPYRPPRLPRPIVAGSHSVVVTGPSGSEIHTDALGRMKGKFFWDRVGSFDDKASCWMRVLQLPIGGSQALARVGWEMIVRYAWGDPDRPIAIARVDNAAHPAPYAYPQAASALAFKTLSSPGGDKFNEITMEDSGGSMMFGITAAKDWTEQVNNDKTEKISANEKLEVGTDLSTTIGANQTIEIGAMNSVTIDGDAGITIAGDRKKTVGAAETVTVQGNLTEKVAGKDTETVGASHTTTATNGISRTCEGSHTLTVGGSYIQTAALDCSVAVAGSKSETTGGAKMVVSGGAINENMIGAMAITVGGAAVQTAGGNRTASAKGSSNLMVGGAAILNAGSKLQMKAPKIKLTVGGAANFIGGGGIVNMTPASVSFVGVISVKGSSAIKISGAPNLVG